MKEKIIEMGSSLTNEGMHSTGSGTTSTRDRMHSSSGETLSTKGTPESTTRGETSSTKGLLKSNTRSNVQTTAENVQSDRTPSASNSTSEDDSYFKKLYENDSVGKAAYENFGIKYMYPWQRLVVANILEAYESQKQGVFDEDMGLEEVPTQNKGARDVDAFSTQENDSEDIEDFSTQGAPEELEESSPKKTPGELSDSFCKGRQIVLLPTGAGKSLCFQIPALLLDGPTLVIYPLLALMTDQQRRMEEGSLRSVLFRGGQTENERHENFEKIKNGAKIILANPEVLQSDRLLEDLKKVGIKHIAIDEAHCVSEWGDSFRPAYLGLGKVIQTINPPLITAFTATASPKVLSRVAEILFNGQAHLVRSESDRPNIHYYVKKAAAKKKEALFLAQTELKPMIIFCGTRDKCEDMAQELNVCFGKKIAKFYHAGLAKNEKDYVEKWFYQSKDGILCATCAYGMGVDKKDIKTVVHLEAPQTAEAYIQEAGRGGRDGSIAKAILIWSLDDSLTYAAYNEDSREGAMKKFAETTVCRRQVLLDALGAEKAYCNGCDLCNKEKEIRAADWEMTYSIVKKRKNYFSQMELEESLFEKMNNIYRRKMGVNIWSHSDTTEVVNQLKNYGKITDSNFLWKGKLKSKKKKN